MLSGVLVITLLAGTAAVAADETVFTPKLSDDSTCESYPTPNGPEASTGFVHRLFNFRPWNAQSRSRRSVGTPGLPQGRRYYGGRYFGQFNNRFYGPQYGNF
jgi:hypothetical protein